MKPTAKSVKAWCEHIILVNSLTWVFQYKDSYQENVYEFVPWFWKYCPICGKSRPIIRELKRGKHNGM